jgi:hypothetical protein
MPRTAARNNDNTTTNNTTERRHYNTSTNKLNTTERNHYIATSRFTKVSAVGSGVSSDRREQRGQENRVGSLGERGVGRAWG